ncbi:MAG: cytochrome c3 family protein [Candidatus Desulfofervidaceae bacterium]|nr:cytochrome c3 family protein [Candidatus Desulfofervidaceae bacterium]MDL1971024.1 cytochrome c family protein [Candidatus Desulfofervidaceae bacterium]
MRYAKILTVVLAAAAFLAVGYKVALSGSCPATITIKDPAFGATKKPGVPFSHKKHAETYGIACTKCHHTFKDDAAVKAGPVKKCSACHKPKAGEKASLSFCKKVSGAPGLLCAYHVNCWGCHKAAKRQGKGRPPTSCTKCHKK